MIKLAHSFFPSFVQNSINIKKSLKSQLVWNGL
jgi:hypothetical protein